MDETTLQLLLALAMLIVTTAVGLLPIKLLAVLRRGSEESSGRSRSWQSLLCCFSGGVFLSTCFLDLLPHIAVKYEAFKATTSMESDFPFPYAFICIGFFLVYFIEEICHRIFKMSHDDDPNRENGIERRKEISLDTAKSASDGLNTHKTEAEPESAVMIEAVTAIHNEVLDETLKYAMSREEEASLLKSLTFSICISLHSILEGFALGVQDSPSGVATLFVSLLLHKAIEGFSVGLKVSRDNVNRTKAVVALIVVYASMTPIGTITGAFLQNSELGADSKLGMILALESMAAGTFIYVTFLEVLFREKMAEVDSLKQLFAVFVGFSLIVAVQLAFSGHNHAAHSALHEHTPLPH